MSAGGARTPVGTLPGHEDDLQRRDEPNGGARVLPDGCIGGEIVEGGGAAVAFVGQGISPGVEAGADNCGPGGKRDDCGQSCGGGGAVSAEGGDVAISAHDILASDLSVHITSGYWKFSIHCVRNPCPKNKYSYRFKSG